MNDHKPKCKCSVCESVRSGASKEEAIESMIRWQDECIEKFGFYVHYVPEGDMLNVHTHGLEETQNHRDLQIFFPASFDHKMLHRIINVVVDLIKEGKIFSDGMVVEGIINDFSVKFIDEQECGRDILRIILPDPEGNLEADDMTADFYKTQYGILPQWHPYKGNK